jgi:hypothetical protein
MEKGVIINKQKLSKGGVLSEGKMTTLALLFHS